jgi:hypothetical protein
VRNLADRLSCDENVRISNFCEALAGDHELTRQELQKRIEKLVMTPKQMPDGVVPEVPEDVGLIRGSDGMLQSSLEGIAQHHMFFRIPPPGIPPAPSSA